MNTAQDLDIEGAIIGSCLTGDYKAIRHTVQEMSEEEFQDARYRTLFKVITRLTKSGHAIDPVTVFSKLTTTEKRTVKEDMILKLNSEVPIALHVPHYVDIAKKRAAELRLQDLYDKLKANPFDEESQKEVRKMWDLLNGGSRQILSLKEAAQNYMVTIDNRKAGKFLNITTGFSKFDDLTGGLNEGNLVVIGARTSVGKTTMLLNLTLPLVRKGHKVLFVSAEMTWDELLDRIVGMETDVYSSSLRRGRFRTDDLKGIMKKIEELSDLPMWCLEGGRMNLGRVRMAVEVLQPTVVMIDFIQRFTPPHHAMNRSAFFSDLANDFKALAMERKIVVFAASQFSREQEKDGNRDPMLSDLKESGGLEEAADVVVLLKAAPDDPLVPNREIEFYVKKNRHGPTGQIDMILNKPKMTFTEKNPFNVA